MSTSSTRGMTTVLQPTSNLVSARAVSIGYWICTALTAFFFVSGGLAYALGVPDVVEGVMLLGFPLYLSGCSASGRSLAAWRSWRRVCRAQGVGLRRYFHRPHRRLGRVRRDGRRDRRRVVARVGAADGGGGHDRIVGAPTGEPSAGRPGDLRRAIDVEGLARARRSAAHR